METQRLRRRRSRRKARKKQVTILVIVALAIGAIVWTRILIDRYHDATMFVDSPSPASSVDEASAKPVADDVAKNLILFVGTGYGIVPMTATRVYAVGEDGSLAVDELTETALVKTTSRNAQTADSAAAMTAYMTGLKVDNEVLSQTPETRPYDEGGRPQAAHGETTCPLVGNGKPVTTLLELAKASGRSIGIVTTARVTQPISGATYAHLCQRDGENTIATQLVPGGNGGNPKLLDGVDVILGGGWQNFLPKEDHRGSVRSDSRDLFAEMRAKGYAVITRESELAALSQLNAQPTGKLLGLFSRSQLSYDLDRAGTNEPSLAEMTTRAIEVLQRNPKGYLLIVEGGRIGDALDASLARKALQEGRAFDDAIAVALQRFRLSDPDHLKTTIVVTADHDHTMVMNGNAAITGRTTETRPGVLGVLRNTNDPTQSASDASGRPFTTLTFGTGEKRVKGPRSQAPALTDVAMTDKTTRYESAIELGSGVGGADVMLSATGAYATRFHGTLDNTQVFALLREAMGL
jgi:alkaline phosphatase